MDYFEKVKQYGITPVIKIPTVEHAVPLAKCLKNAGIPLIEVTMRNECALDGIRAIRAEVPDMLISAGTVLSAKQAQDAVDAGVDAIVTPGLNREVVEYCIEKKIPVLPGCITATEIEQGRCYGLSTFKFFPAELSGGVKTIKELNGPFQDIDFIPTSGINFDNMGSYLSNDHVLAVGGSFMAPADLVLAEKWEEIALRCKRAIQILHNFRLFHVGINAGGEGAALAQLLSGMLDLEYRPGNKSDFAGDYFEICKEKFPGTMGHIAIGTRNPDRAVAYLESKGFAFTDYFKNYDAAGRLNSIYLAQEFGGFAIHLLRKP